MNAFSKNTAIRKIVAPNAKKSLRDNEILGIKSRTFVNTFITAANANNDNDPFHNFGAALLNKKLTPTRTPMSPANAPNRLSIPSPTSILFIALTRINIEPDNTIIALENLNKNSRLHTLFNIARTVVNTNIPLAKAAIAPPAPDISCFSINSVNDDNAPTSITIEAANLSTAFAIMLIFGVSLAPFNIPLTPSTIFVSPFVNPVTEPRNLANCIITAINAPLIPNIATLANPPFLTNSFSLSMNDWIPDVSHLVLPAEPVIVSTESLKSAA